MHPTLENAPHLIPGVHLYQNWCYSPQKDADFDTIGVLLFCTPSNQRSLCGKGLHDFSHTIAARKIPSAEHSAEGFLRFGP